MRLRCLRVASNPHVCLSICAVTDELELGDAEGLGLHAADAQQPEDAERVDTDPDLLDLCHDNTVVDSLQILAAKHTNVSCSLQKSEKRVRQMVGLVHVLQDFLACLTTARDTQGGHMIDVGLISL